MILRSRGGYCAGIGDAGGEQRMKSGSYAVLTLFFAVPQSAAKSCNSRKRLMTPALRGIIRRSQLPNRRVTLLVTLFLADGLTEVLGFQILLLDI